MFVADNVWVEDDNTHDDEHQAKELNDDVEGDADEIDPFTNLCKLSHFSSSNHFRMAESLWAWLSSVTGSSTTSCLVRF
jgi:hypothetical protein